MTRAILITLALLISAPADARGGRCYCGYFIRAQRAVIDWPPQPRHAHFPHKGMRY